MKLGSGDEQVYLVDLLDRLIETGVVLRGMLVITVADIELLFLDLSLLLTSVERANGAPNALKHSLRSIDGQH